MSGPHTCLRSHHPWDFESLHSVAGFLRAPIAVAATVGDIGNVEGLEECDDANGTDWDGCTDCTISQFLINTHTSDHQAAAGAALNDDGTFVVVFEGLVRAALLGVRN